MLSSVKKRGQVTIFLVIGIVLLALAASIFFFVNKSATDSLQQEQEQLEFTTVSEIRPQLQRYVEQCIEEVSVPGIYLLGIQGGVIYSDDPTSLLITERGIVNYGYLNGITQLSSEKLETQLNRYILESLPRCLKGFTVFENQGVTISTTDMNPDVRITPDAVVVTLQYPVTALQADSAVSLDTFRVSIPIRVGTIIGYSTQIIEQHTTSPYLDTPYLTSLDVFATVYPFSEDVTLYSLRDEESIIDNAPFTFFFAIKNDGSTAVPKLQHIRDLVLAKGELFELQLYAFDADNDAMTFSSDNAQFGISNDGLLSVTPQQTGTFFVRFTVTDTTGMNDEQEVRIVVE
jgi:hypothetical protein